MNAPLATGFAGFRAVYDSGRGALVTWRGVADLETPVAAFLKLAQGRPNAFLLESVEGGAARGRYSIIGMDPDLIWRCRDGRAEVNRARARPRRTPSWRTTAAGAGQPARADRRDAAGRAGRPAADGGRAGRLSRLRHGAADGAAAGEEPRRDRRAGRAAAAPDAVRDLRQRERRADPGRAGLSAQADVTAEAAWASAQARLAEAEDGAGTPAAASGAAGDAARRRRRRHRTSRKDGLPGGGGALRRSTSPPATRSRSC